VLTFHVGAQGAVAGAQAMARHVMQPTLTPDIAAAAAYYAKVPGVGPGQTFSQTLPVVRADIDPDVADLFGLDPRRPMTEIELTNLLAGRRTNGEPIPGRRAYRTAGPLAETLGLASDRPPTEAEIAAVLSGRRADRDEALPPARANLLQLRFARLYGGGEGTTADDVVAAVASGRRLDGGPLKLSGILDGLNEVRERTAFIDLCFSAPKSYSVAVALAETEAERAVLMDAHRVAVARTMAHIELVLGAIRRGDSGRRGRERGRLAWATCDHWTARPTLEIPTQDTSTGERFTAFATVRAQGDPQAHTHVLVPTVSLTEGSHVGSVDTDTLRGRVHVWGRLYAATLATELRRLGVSVSLDPKTATAKVDAIPEAVCEAFSKRSRQGELAARAYAAEKGISWDALDDPARIGLLKSATQGDGRAAKKDDIANLHAWRSEAEAAGWIGRSIIDLDQPRALAPHAERMEMAYRAGAEVLAREFQGRAIVDEIRARVAAAAGLVAAGIAEADEVEVVSALLIERGVMDGDSITAIIKRTERGPRGGVLARLTTAAHVGREEQVVDLVRAAFADTEGALAPAAIEASMRALGLDVDGEHGRAQLAAAQSLGRARFGATVGSAGSGKSALVGGLVREWQRQGRRVYATATAWRQAVALTDAGIAPNDCIALKPFLARVRTGKLTLDRDAVIVVDEASLVSVADALQLLAVRAATGATMITLGDPMQGQAIEAGGFLDLIARATGPIPTIATTIRQRCAGERRLAGLAREGEAADVLVRLREEGRASLVPGPAAAVAHATAEAWWARRAGDGVAPLVVVPTNSDARAVGDAIRRKLQSAGEIGPDRMEIEAGNLAGERYALRIAVGDVLRLYARTYVRGRSGVIGVNGSTVRVEEVRDAGLLLRNGTSPPAFVPWDNLRDRRNGTIMLSSGHAATLASAQGATAGSVIAAFPQGTAAVDASGFYVAVSRHRDHVEVLIGEAAERRTLAQRRSPTDVSAIRSDAIWAAAAANLSRRVVRPTALDFLDRARAAREAAADVLRVGAVRLEACKVRGGEPTRFPTRRRQRLAQAILAPLRRALVDAVKNIAALKEAVLAVRNDIRQPVEGRVLDASPQPRPGRRRSPTAAPGGTALRR